MCRFEARTNQSDGRIGNTINFDRTRPQGSFDVYNLFNANPVLDWTRITDRPG
jgi:hypothetical protein